MDIDHYAEAAMDLVNADVSSVAGVRAHLADRAWLADAVVDDDVTALSEGRAHLAAVVDAAAAGDEQGVVRRLNQLLDRHPIHPRISGHDAQSWHLHVHDLGTGTAEVVMAEALFGLAVVVTDRGALRMGRCAAEACGRAFLDLSPNRSRKFCSTRCATRTNVAAHRRRQQA